MVVTTIIEDGKYRKNVSDNNKYIRKVGTDEVYAEAIDLIEFEYTYEETNEDIELLEEIEQLEDIE